MLALLSLINKCIYLSEQNEVASLKYCLYNVCHKELPASSWRLVGHVVISCYQKLKHRKVNIRPSARERGAGALDGVAKFTVFTKI